MLISRLARAAPAGDVQHQMVLSVTVLAGIAG